MGAEELPTFHALGRRHYSALLGWGDSNLKQGVCASARDKDSAVPYYVRAIQSYERAHIKPKSSASLDENRIPANRYADNMNSALVGLKFILNVEELPEDLEELVAREPSALPQADYNGTTRLWIVPKTGQSEETLSEMHAMLDLAARGCREHHDGHIDWASGTYYKAYNELDTGNLPSAARLFRQTIKLYRSAGISSEDSETEYKGHLQLMLDAEKQYSALESQLELLESKARRTVTSAEKEKYNHGFIVWWAAAAYKNADSLVKEARNAMSRGDTEGAIQAYSLAGSLLFQTIQFYRIADVSYYDADALESHRKIRASASRRLPTISRKLGELKRRMEQEEKRQLRETENDWGDLC